MALKGFNRIAWAPDCSLGLPCELFQFVPHTEGTALLFESEWCFNPPTAPHPLLPHPLPPAHHL